MATWYNGAVPAPQMQMIWGPMWTYDGTYYDGGMAWYCWDGQQMQQQQQQQFPTDTPTGNAEEQHPGEAEAGEEGGDDDAAWPTLQQGRSSGSRGKAGKTAGGKTAGGKGGNRGKGSGKAAGGQAAMRRSRRFQQESGDVGEERPEGTNQAGQPGFGLRDFLGTWTDTLGNIVDVTYAAGTKRRGPLAVRLSRDGKEQMLTLRRDASSGIWACGNAVLDTAASTLVCVVWTTLDGRRSVWSRQDENAGNDADTVADGLGQAPAQPKLVEPATAAASNTGATAPNADGASELRAVASEAVASPAQGSEGSEPIDFHSFAGGRRLKTWTCSTEELDFPLDVGDQPGTEESSAVKAGGSTTS